MSFGLDQICSASFCNCILILDLLLLCIGFFFFSPSVISGQKKKKRPNKTQKPLHRFLAFVIVLYFLLLLLFFKAFPAPQDELKLSASQLQNIQAGSRRCVGQRCVQPSRRLRPQPNQSGERSLGKGCAAVRCSPGQTLLRSHAHHLAATERVHAGTAENSGDGQKKPQGCAES